MGPRTEAGNTLVETLVAVSILGIAVIALISGMGVAVASSDAHRKQSVSQTYLIQAAEYVKSLPFKACNDPSIPGVAPYSLSGMSSVPPSGYSASVVSVQLSDGTGAFNQWWTPAATPAYVTSACPTGNPPKVQLVNIEVRSNDGRGVESTSVAKRSIS